MKDFNRYWNALNYAFIKYENLKRKSNNIPYVIHPIRVALILRSIGFSEFKNQDLMIAALLHDLIEDTNTTFDEIKNEFNESIALLVNELSKPKDLNKEKWLETFINASEAAKIIKMADRIDNLMDMKQWPLEKQKSYAEQGKIILEKCGNANYKLASILQKQIELYLK